MQNIDHHTSTHSILDFEASSLSDCSYPISAGLAVGDRTYYWIIKPKAEWIDWSLASQAIHGMKRSFLFENGQDASQVYVEMLEILRGHDTVYSDNPYWETRWLNTLGNFPIVIRDIKELIPQNSHHLFKEVLYNQFQLYKLIPHRADHDALAISMAVSHLRQQKKQD